MADQDSWDSFKTMENIFATMDSALDTFKTYAVEMEKFKMGVLDNVGRKAELKKIIDEHPDWTMTNITAKYNEMKTIHDYLEAL
jgi:hypothetical protein